MAAGHRGARQPDVQRAPASGHGSVPGRVRGLDRADRGGRTAAGAAAATGDRAQPRPHPVGRRQRQDVHARSRVDRQEQPPDQRRRTDLRGEFRPRPARGHGPRPERELCPEHPDQGTQERGPVPLSAADAAVLLLGRRAHLGQSPLQPVRSAQSDDRQQGPGLADFEAPRRAPASGLVQRSGEQARGLVDAPARRPSRFVLRPGGPEVHADRDLLQHPPPAVRQRCQRDRLLQRRRRRPFLGRHEGLRRDRRRAAGRRLVSPGRRHERRRRDHEALERRGRLCGRLHLPGRCREGPGGTNRGGRGRDHPGARSPVRHAAFVRPLLGHSEPGR